jgi:hypothetical protein
MRMILSIVEQLGLLIGSVTAAGLLCWLLWRCFRPIGHPDWGALVLVALALLAIAGMLPDSRFLDLSLVFAALAALPLWLAGRTWRRQHGEATGAATRSWTG